MFIKSIQAKIILPTALALILLIFCLTGYAALGFIDNSEAMVFNDISNTANALKNDLEHMERLTKAAAVSIASGQDMVRAVKERDRSMLLKELPSELKLYCVDYCTVYDEDGFVLSVSNDRSLLNGSDLMGQNAAWALDGKLSTYYESGPSVRVAVCTNTPVYDNGKVIGAVSAGIRLDKNEFVDSIKELYTAEAAVFLGNTGVAATMRQNGARIAGPAIPDRAETKIDSGKEYVSEEDILREKYYSAYIPLRDSSGKTFAAIFIGRPKQEIMAVARTFAGISIIIGAAGFAASMLVLSLTVRRIAEPIRMLTKYADNIAHGIIDTDIEILSKDEIGLLGGALRKVLTNNRMLCDDLNKMKYEVSVKGDLDYRIDASKYQGCYRTVSESINSLAGILTSDIFTAVKILGRVSKGEFGFKVKKLPGKRAIINKAGESLVSKLNCIIAEIRGFSRGTAKGDFKIRADASNCQGIWADILNELNELANAISAPLTEMDVVLEEMAAGNFEARIVGEFKGDFNAVKCAVNKAGDITLLYISEISEILNGIAAGDLSQVIVDEYAGAYTPVKTALIRILESLNKSMRSIESAAEQVKAGAGQVSESSMYLAEGAAKQAAAIQYLSASIETIDEKTRQNAESAAAADCLTQTSGRSFQQSNEAMKSVILTMAETEKSSGRIEKITKTIDDIAFQTNLLALNAAVESARAGEHGKGFAVVSEEVRSLALKSRDAAQETADLISDSIEKVSSGLRQAQSTAASLDGISGDVSRVMELISVIDDMSQEQAESIAQVTSGIGEISSVIQSNSAISQECASASLELNSQVEMLKELVGFFKLRP